MASQPLQPLDESYDPLVGNSIEGYQILGRLGKGAFGVVYLARHPRLNREVAVKYFELQEPDAVKSVNDEVNILERLSHPHIVRIEDHFSKENYHFIMMQLVKGGNLRQKLKMLNGDTLDLPTISILIEQIASALDYVHSQKILHLDLKPENIMVDPIPGNRAPSFILTDFGIARLMRPDNQLSALAGTPLYMSPEQFDFENREVNHRSDIYSLGVILYELIVGVAPFRANAIYEIARQHRHEEPKSPAILVPGLPQDIADVTLTALKKDPAERFASAGELSAALMSAMRSQGYSDSSPTAARLNQIASQHADGIQQLSLRSAFTAPPAPPPPETLALRIAVMGPDGVEKIHTFNKSSIVVGRSPDADLVLDDTQVSREHLRVDFGGDGRLYVTDLKSRNKTYLEGDTLVADQRYPWQPNQYVMVRGFLLRLDMTLDEYASVSVPAAAARSGSAAAGVMPELPSNQLVNLLNRAQEKSRKPLIKLVVSSEVIHIHPGRPYYVKVHVRPEGTPTTTYRLRVLPGSGGINESWYTLPAPKTLAPNENHSFDMTITAPHVRAGTYEMFIGVVADDSSIPDSAQLIKVVVDPEIQFAVSLHPNTVTHRRFRKRNAELTISNQSNVEETFVISVQSHDCLNTTLSSNSVKIGDKQKAIVKVRLKPLGGAREAGQPWYTVKARSQTTGEEKEQTGVYAFSAPRGWRPSLLTLLVSAVLLALAVFVILRLMNGASLNQIGGELGNFISGIRDQIQQFVQGLGGGRP